MIRTAPTITVPIRMDDHGTIRIASTRVTLDVVIASYLQNETPEEIHESFPTLQLADIYAVIAYYLNNRDVVDAYLRQRDAERERFRREFEAAHPEMFKLQARLRERFAKRD